VEQGSALPPLSSGVRLLGGRFVVGEMLGRGGMGAVYDVRDLALNVDLALKTSLDSRRGRVEALQNEFRALQGVSHPNLVRLHELFHDDGRWFFTMERVRGVPFTAFVRPAGLDLRRLRRALAQLTEGLLALHDVAKIHRDIKPSNTLVEAHGRLVLLDFGLIGDTRRAIPALMQGAGTVAYMAPEQASGTAGPAADWYSVGVMLYEALTGVLPFDGTPREILDRKLAEQPRSPSALAAGIPIELECLCMELLDKDPEKRPGGEEILEATETIE
jgi:serine/threonine protein kinase